jgi:hypothetical protein
LARAITIRRISVSLLTRFKSDEKLQAEALDILTEMIRRNLLTVSAFIDDPPVSFSCRVREAIITGSRSATQKEIIRELLTGEPIKRKGGPGIELLLNQNFRLPPEQEAQVRAALTRDKLPGGL